eukprot:TRINITY_DN1852_c0_g1_i1.p1 TRINITY_DN1852_c0_g1~~TRINITY_DN1852_c0_g1_i1.p1  ORF type:complete len:1197 (+),score=251.22 TRINITY_DN1852_c0_g1_i1:88-3678(+)
MTTQSGGDKGFKTDVQVIMLSTTGDIPSNRYGHTAVVYKDSMFVYGGVDSHRKTDNALYEYSFETRKWRTIPTKGSHPTPRSCHTCHVIGDSMIVFGGIDGQKQLLSSVYEYSFVSNEWKEIQTTGQTPTPRFNHCSIVYNNALFVFGGSKDSVNASQLSKAFRLDLAKKEWTIFSQCPKPVSGHSATLVDDVAYFFGGWSKTLMIGSCSSKLMRLNMTTREWSEEELELPPASRRFHSAVSLGKLIYIFGGDGLVRQYNDLYALDTAAMQWKKCTLRGRECDIPFTRYKHSGVVYKHKMYVFGGDYGIAQKYFNDLSEFQLVDPRLSMEIPVSVPKMLQVDDEPPVPKRVSVSRADSLPKIPQDAQQQQPTDDVPAMQPNVNEIQPAKAHPNKIVIDHKIMDESWLLEQVGATLSSYSKEQYINDKQLLDDFKRVTGIRWQKAFQAKHGDILIFLSRHPSFFKVMSENEQRYVKMIKNPAADKQKETQPGTGSISSSIIRGFRDVRSAVENSFNQNGSNRRSTIASLSPQTQTEEITPKPVDSSPKIDQSSIIGTEERPADPLPSSNQTESSESLLFVKSQAEASPALSSNEFHPISDSISTTVTHLEQTTSSLFSSYNPLVDDLVNTFISIFMDMDENEIYVAKLGELFLQKTGSRWMVAHGAKFGSIANFLENIDTLFTVRVVDASTIVHLNLDQIDVWKEKMEKLKIEQQQALQEQESQRIRRDSEAKYNRVIDHRKRVMQELLTTERTYVNNLHLIIKKFMQPIQAAPATKRILSDEDYKSIFYLIESIYQLHQSVILPGLQKSIEPSESVAKLAAVFVEAEHFLKIYGGYLDNYEAAAATLKRCLQSSNFSLFMKETMKDPACQNLDLLSFLIQPVQRIPRYKLLLDELIKATPDTDPDHSSLASASSIVKKTASHANSRIKSAYIRDKLGKIDGFEKYLSPSRHYVTEGTGTIYATKKNSNSLLGQGTVIVFSDMILICVGRSIQRSMEWSVLWIIDADHESFELSLVDPEHTYNIVASSIEAKLQLISAIQERLVEYYKQDESAASGKRSVKYTYKKGNVYEGDMLRGKRHGQGRMIYEDQSQYDGEWDRNKREGKGFYSKAAGEKTEYYVGEWENDMPNGQGTRMYPTGIQVKGLFEQGKPVGKVEEISVDGSKYMGQWNNEKRNGFGIMDYDDGGRYEGYFVDGLR